VSRPFIDFDSVSNTNSSKNVIACPTHGDYPASMKNFGCPDCVKEREEYEEELEELSNSRVRRFNGRR